MAIYLPRVDPNRDIGRLRNIDIADKRRASLRFEMPCSILDGETCLEAFAVAAVGTAAGAADNLYQRRAARGLQSLKGENVRHKLPPFFVIRRRANLPGDSKDEP
jgi:hypothetical protein